MHTLKWGQTSSRCRQRVVSILDPDQVGAPRSRVLGHQTSEAGFQLLVQALGLAVGFRMVPRSQVDGGSDELTKLPPEP